LIHIMVFWVLTPYSDVIGCQNPQDCGLNIHCHENLKSHNL